MKLTIEMELDNDAFQFISGGINYNAVKRDLNWTVTKIQRGCEDGKVMDINGNSVGKFEITR